MTLYRIFPDFYNFSLTNFTVFNFLHFFIHFDTINMKIQKKIITILIITNFSYTLAIN